jgi:hypothetical protein
MTQERFPWEPEPAPLSVDETLAALRRDFAYVVRNTAVTVHSNRDALAMLVNTPRGQIIPRGEVKFSDGTTVEFQDIGMCQPGAPYMTVPELLTKVWETARELGLELK